MSKLLLLPLFYLVFVLVNSSLFAHLSLLSTDIMFRNKFSVPPKVTPLMSLDCRPMEPVTYYPPFTFYPSDFPSIPTLEYSNRLLAPPKLKTNPPHPSSHYAPLKYRPLSNDLPHTHLSINPPYRWGNNLTHHPNPWSHPLYRKNHPFVNSEESSHPPQRFQLVNNVRPPYPPHQTAPKIPENKDYQKLKTHLFRASQARIHMNNWKHTPRLIKKQIDNLFDNLCPPSRDDLFFVNLKRLKFNTERDICDFVTAHLTKTLSINRSELSGLNCDKGNSTQEVIDTLMNKFPKSVGLQQIKSWVETDNSLSSNLNRDSEEFPIFSYYVHNRPNISASSPPLQNYMEVDIITLTDQGVSAPIVPNPSVIESVPLVTDSIFPGTSTTPPPQTLVSNVKNTVTPIVNPIAINSSSPPLKKRINTSNEVINLKNRFSPLSLENCDEIEGVFPLPPASPVVASSLNNDKSQLRSANKKRPRRNTIGLVTDIPFVPTLDVNYVQATPLKRPSCISSESNNISKPNMDITTKPLPPQPTKNVSPLALPSVIPPVPLDSVPIEASLTSKILTLPPSYAPVSHSKNIFIHSGKNKNNWTINPHENTNILIVADSNLKLSTVYKPGCEIHSFSGGNLNNITQVLKRLPTNNKIKQVITVVGLNNRSDNTDKIKTEIDNLKDALQRFNDYYFTGISFGPYLEPKQVETLSMLNSYAELVFGDLHFIKNIPHSLINLVPGDQWGIHHDSETANLVLEEIFHFLLEQRLRNEPVT